MQQQNGSYGAYLGLDKLLSAQQLASTAAGEPAHEELLFIIVHQAYELWFKQILHELNSIVQILSRDYVEDRYLTTIVERCERVKQIQLLLNQQIAILQSMTPMDFLNFRRFLGNASGFQSYQFRSIEIKLGRKFPSLKPIIKSFSEQEQKELLAMGNQQNLFDCVNTWLEHMPFLKYDDFNFWKLYKKATTDMLQQEQLLLQQDNLLTAQEKSTRAANLQDAIDTFQSFLSPTESNAENWPYRLSQQAMVASLFIFLYRKHPILNLPYTFLSLLMDIDENLTIWRQKHVMMVERMIGGKMGTGGSSGHQYLQSTVESARIFKDLFKLGSFLVPSNALPALPDALQRELDFNFSFKLQQTCLQS